MRSCCAASRSGRPLVVWGRLRAAGLVVGGSYGPMAGTVFRLGHMGTQADMGLMQQALGVLETEIKRLRG